MTKKTSTIKKATSTRKIKKPSRSGKLIDKARLNQIIQIFKKASEKSDKKNITLKLSTSECEHIIDGLTKAKRYRLIHEEHKKLKQKHNLFDEVTEYYLNIIVRARKAIPEKGADLDDYKEMCRIIKAPLPKLGKRDTYSEELKLEILKYHAKSIKDIRKKNRNKILLPSQKKVAVLAVKNEYFPMTEPDSVTQSLRRFGAEKGTLPGNRAFAGRKKTD